MGLLAGCGDDTTTSTPDAADATSCADIADGYVEITRDIINQIGDRTDAAMQSPSADLEAAADEWFKAAAELIPRVADLCAAGEFDELLCDRESTIEPAGEAGERFLQDNYPDCSQGLPEQTTIP